MTESLHSPDGMTPKVDLRLTRRGMAGLAVGAGYAVAMQPVNAQDLVTTDAEGLVEGDVTIKSFDGVQLASYMARPEGDGPFPTVIVVNEIFGIHEWIRDITRRFAKLGYFAVAPGFFHRAGDPSQYQWDEEGRKRIFEIVNATPHDQVMKDSDAAVAWLEAQETADVDRLGITGFCWGGRIVWTYAAKNPKVKAGAAWYGRLVDPEGTPGEPLYPVEVAEKIKGRVVGFYGTQDRGIPVDDVETMREALKAAGDETSKIVLYDAQHGFHADYRAQYDAASSKDAWAKLQTWFSERGVA